MEINPETQLYIDLFLKKVREEPGHRLSPQDRLQIYKSLGDFTKQKDIFDLRDPNNPEFVKLNLNTADKALAWLAIITAMKVLPICFELDGGSFIINESNYSNSPFEMVEKAGKLLNGKINALDAWGDLIDTFYFGLISIDDSLNEKSSCAVYAGFAAFSITMCGFESLEKSANQNLNDSVDFSQNDFAAFAERAYTSYDENPPGLWPDRKYGKYKDQYKPLTIDEQKRLEFWEWWLTEAIPQAWEMVQ